VKQKEIFNIELPEFKKKTIDLYGFIVWNADKKSFFYCKFGTSEPIYEFSAENGNLIAKY
jgi:macrodomain Ter protein organizer (MatP/YcbG family)